MEGPLSGGSRERRYGTHSRNSGFTDNLQMVETSISRSMKQCVDRSALKFFTFQKHSKAQ